MGPSLWTVRTILFIYFCFLRHWETRECCIFFCQLHLSHASHNPKLEIWHFHWPFIVGLLLDGSKTTYYLVNILLYFHIYLMSELKHKWFRFLAKQKEKYLLARKHSKCFVSIRSWTLKVTVLPASSIWCFLKKHLEFWEMKSNFILFFLTCQFFWVVHF